MRSVRAVAVEDAPRDDARHHARRADAIKEFDKDGDGKLNEEERKAMMEANRARMEEFRKAREKEFDKDGDGKLNDEERKAMREAHRKAQAQGRPKPPPKGNE